jgi:hypothetical protein
MGSKAELSAEERAELESTRRVVELQGSSVRHEAPGVGWEELESKNRKQMSAAELE